MLNLLKDSITDSLVSDKSLKNYKPTQGLLNLFKKVLSPKLSSKEEFNPTFIIKQRAETRGSRKVLIIEIYKKTKEGLELVARREEELPEKKGAKNLKKLQPKPTPKKKNDEQAEQKKRLQQEEAAKKKKVAEQKNIELKQQQLHSANKKSALSQAAILRKIIAKQANIQKQLQQEKINNEKQNLLKQNLEQKYLAQKSLEQKFSLTTKAAQLQQTNKTQAATVNTMVAFFNAHKSLLNPLQPKPTQPGYLAKPVNTDKINEQPKNVNSSCKFFEQRKLTKSPEPKKPESPEQKLLRQPRQAMNPAKHKAEQLLSKLSGGKNSQKQAVVRMIK